MQGPSLPPYQRDLSEFETKLRKRKKLRTKRSDLRRKTLFHFGSIISFSVKTRGLSFSDTYSSSV